jgi:ABC-type glycerol-3-phosphate transport system permease component
MRIGKTARKRLGQVAVILILSAGAVAVMIPFFWMLSTSLKGEADILTFPPDWIPRPAYWDNYVKAVTVIPFFNYLKNTLTVTVVRLVGTVLTSALVAYGFARLRAPGLDTLFLIVLSTMMLPGQVTLIPTFIIFSKIDWIDTFLPLVVPAYFGGGAFNVFLLRQFFMTIPLEMDDAARIDGCSYFGVFWRIIVPLSAPALATVSIFNVMWSWNEFMGPLIYLQSTSKFTLALGLNFFRDVYNPTWNLLMANSVLLLLPCLLLFFFAQRLFIQGVVVTGIKG